MYPFNDSGTDAARARAKGEEGYERVLSALTQTEQAIGNREFSQTLSVPLGKLTKARGIALSAAREIRSRLEDPYLAREVRVRQASETWGAARQEIDGLLADMPAQSAIVAAHLEEVILPKLPPGVEEHSAREKVRDRLQGVTDVQGTLKAWAADKDPVLRAAAVGAIGEDVIASGRVPEQLKDVARSSVKQAAMQWESVNGTPATKAAVRGLQADANHGGIPAGLLGLTMAVRVDSDSRLNEAKGWIDHARGGLPPSSAQVLNENRVMRAELERRRAADVGGSR